jgi:metal-responsive CopG/Arc/MetJ family transcriptional regulator
MKSLSLKIEDSIIKETDELIKDIKISRNQYINQAIAYYNNIKKKNKIEKQLRDSSKLVAKNSMEVLKEFEELEETFDYGD